MKERTRDLAEQAGSTHKQNLGVYQFYESELEKFAELIIRECIDIVDDAVLHREPASTYVEKIKQNFGIEE